MSGAHAMMNAMLDALARETARAAGAETALVSVTFDILAEGEAARHETAIVRATRTLVFSSGEALGADGKRLMAATAVHRIVR
ncbi:MAG: hypothetical protein AB7J28_06060 [Hyphomonadaceae bacterium]